MFNVQNVWKNKIESVGLNRWPKKYASDWYVHISLCTGKIK